MKAKPSQPAHPASAAIPIVGIFTTGGKYGLRYGDDAIDALRGLRGADDLAAAGRGARPRPNPRPGPAARACNCFVAGTPVATAEGNKPIEDIAVGDKVWAKNLSTGARELRTVVGLFHKHADELMDLTVAGTTVTVTPRHPFWAPGRGWTMSGNLRPGDRLLQRDGTTVTITAISRCHRLQLHRGRRP